MLIAALWIRIRIKGPPIRICIHFNFQPDVNLNNTELLSRKFLYTVKYRMKNYVTYDADKKDNTALL
jgi:hypothetical protein